MKIAVFGDYGYWNDGHGWQGFGESGTEEAVVVQLASAWAGHDEGFVVEDAIGITVEDARTKIEQAYHFLLEEGKRKTRMTQLKTSIRHAEMWLENMDTEKLRQEQSLVRCRAELEELENWK